jgi:hypothetical protein
MDPEQMKHVGWIRAEGLPALEGMIRISLWAGHPIKPGLEWSGTFEPALGSGIDPLWDYVGKIVTIKLDQFEEAKALITDNAGNFQGAGEPPKRISRS